MNHAYHSDDDIEASTPTYIHVHTRTYTRTYIHIYMYVNACIHVSIQIYICICIHINEQETIAEGNHVHHSDDDSETTSPFLEGHQEMVSLTSKDDMSHTVSLANSASRHRNVFPPSHAPSKPTFHIP